MKVDRRPAKENARKSTKVPAAALLAPSTSGTSKSGGGGSGSNTSSQSIPLQPKVQQMILLQRAPKVFLSKSEDGLHRIFFEQQPPVALSVTDADLRDQLNVNAAAAEAVHAATDVFQQGAASVTYVNSADGLSPATTDFVGLGGETVHIGADDTDHQTISAMDVYPLGHHINTPNTTYVYTTEYAPPYYQYQPLNSPGQQTYIIQQQNSPGSVEEDTNAQLGHTTRASPATIQWLINNYEPADGTSLPRCTLYEHYQRHCRENGLDQVNPASFGKLIRSVFHGLRTRRLGTRGNSKYHYYGIRIKPDSPLNNGMTSSISLTDDYGRQSFSHQISHVTTRSGSSRRSGVTNGGATSGRNSVTNIVDSGAQHSQTNNSSTSPSPVYVTNGHPVGNSAFQPCHNQSSNSSSNGENCGEVDRDLLGDGDVPAIQPPDMQDLQRYLLPLGLNVHHAIKFFDGYAAACAEVLECVKQLQFEAVEECWATFWQPETEQEDVEDDECIRNEKMLKSLSQTQLFTMCTIPPMFAYIQAMDCAFYQVIAEVLIPDVLQPNMSSTLTTQIRNFAKSLEGQMKKAMQGAPDYIQKKKLKTVRLLAQLLRRYTSLNHLATAARGVLQKPDQIQQMYQDFSRVDISNIQDQAGWICDCDPVLVSNLYSDFCENLQQQKSLEQWADWLEAVVDQVLAKYHSESYMVLCEIAKNFLKNWSFYSSMVVRDLTLRSAQSFGSFHLIRLLFDEYLLYIVEAKLAKVSNKPIISVMVVEKSDEMMMQHSMETVVTPSATNNNIPVMQNAIVTVAGAIQQVQGAIVTVTGGRPDESNMFMEEENIQFVDVPSSDHMTN